MLCNEANAVMMREAGPLWTFNRSGEAPAAMACHYKNIRDKKLIFRQSGSRLFQQAQVMVIRTWRMKSRVRRHLILSRAATFHFPPCNRKHCRLL